MVAIVRVFFVFFVACSIGNSYAGWFGPSNYEECILEKMKDAKSSVAAAAIADACRKKFPLKVKAVSGPKMLWLPSDAVARIRLACKESEPEPLGTRETVEQWRRRVDGPPPGMIDCVLYNGNGNWTISNVVVRFTELSSGNYFDNDVGVMFSMGPLSTTNVRINRSIVTGEIRTSIVSAKGFVQ